MLLIFDVNETLLDLSALDPHFEALFGSTSIRQDWFNQVLKSAFASVIIGPYRDFGQVARSAMEMVAARHNLTLTDEATEAILSHMRNLPPHSDILPGIKSLKEAGFRMAALTNSPPDVAKDQLENAGIAPYLEAMLSVDASESLKPAAVIYHDALKTLGSDPASACLIAAHAWDIAGAMRAGWHGAFIERPGKVWNPLFESPTFTGKDLGDVADWLIG